MPVSLTVNGQRRDVDVDPNTPLLWVIREDLGLTGTKYGCGIAQCGACTVHVDGEPLRSCSAPVSAVAGKRGDDDRRPLVARRQGGAEGVGRPRRRPVRLLPVGPDHVGDGAAREESRSRATPTSTTRWPATSAAARPTTASAPRSTPRRRRSPDEERHARPSPPRSRRPRAPRCRFRRCPPPAPATNRPVSRGAPSCKAPAASVVVVGWGGHDAARAAAPVRPRRRGRRDRAARAERLRPRRHRQPRHRRLQAPRDGPGQHDRPGVAGRRRARRRLGAGAHRVRAVGPEALREPDVRRPAGHRRLVRDRQFVPAVPQRRRDGAGDARRRRGRGVEGAGERDPHREERAHARLGPARDLRRDGRGGKPRRLRADNPR